MPFAKDTSSSWIYVGTAFVVHFTISMSMKVWGVMYLILLKRFAQSATVTSWPGSLCSLMMGVAGKSIMCLADGDGVWGWGWGGGVEWFHSLKNNGYEIIESSLNDFYAS